MKSTVVLLTTFSREWHALERARRSELEAQHLHPLVAKYAGRLAIRFLNSLGFDSRYSHMAIIETEELKDYYFFIEELRDSLLLAEGYLVINRIIVGYEDGYPQFDEETAGAAT
ncbi:darcynin family protein [Streptomyces sp. NPDC091266]|uniref:darcynin family protein n=1 Tax=Streptomyces sp. NPDC091266 TaxID=3365978 RepID=UPI0038260091